MTGESVHDDCGCADDGVASQARAGERDRVPIVSIFTTCVRVSMTTEGVLMTSQARAGKRDRVRTRDPVLSTITTSECVCMTGGSVHDG